MIGMLVHGQLDQTLAEELMIVGAEVFGHLQRDTHPLAAEGFDIAFGVFLILRIAVDRKQIQEHAQLTLVGFLPNELCGGVPHAGKGRHVGVVRVTGGDPIAIMPELPDQAFIIRTRDHQIHIVIPGNKALVTYCTQQCAAGHKESDVVLCAKILQTFEHIHAQRLDLLSVKTKALTHVRSTPHRFRWSHDPGVYCPSGRVICARAHPGGGSGRYGW